jgi:4-amino-4-deoxy-L-arabinose transferase-like glycosyltransferase
VAARLIAIGVLFVNTDHEAVPFGRLFGDEEYFIRRAIWLSHLAMGIPISLADVKYAFDETIHTSLVWLLAAINVLVGPAQYGLRFVSALIYLAGVVALYRAVRPAFGKPAAMAGLILLVFLPSLFVWSISILKEPVFFALMAAVVWLTVTAARQPSWIVRTAVGLAIAAAAVGAETLRDGGLIVAGAGSLAGVAAGFAASRPRLIAAFAIVAVAVTVPAMAIGPVRDRLAAGVASAAQRHWDHVRAPGHSYMLFEPEFYREPPRPNDVTPRLAAQLVVGGVAAYVLVPMPGQMQSTAELAYLPEQLLWYGLVLLMPIGVAAALRRDRFTAAVLAVHLLMAVALVALTAGNIGTLVRHRALAMPYLVWFSGLGFTVVLSWLLRLRASTAHRQRPAEV